MLVGNPEQSGIFFISEKSIRLFKTIGFKLECELYETVPFGKYSLLLADR